MFDNDRLKCQMERMRIDFENEQANWLEQHRQLVEANFLLQQKVAETSDVYARPFQILSERLRSQAERYEARLEKERGERETVSLALNLSVCNTNEEIFFSEKSLTLSKSFVWSCFL